MGCLLLLSEVGTNNSRLSVRRAQNLTKPILFVTLFTYMNSEKINTSYDQKPWPFDPPPDRNGELPLPGN